MNFVMIGQHRIEKEVYIQRYRHADYLRIHLFLFVVCVRKSRRAEPINYIHVCFVFLFIDATHQR
jgi:hypothetical protein